MTWDEISSHRDRRRAVVATLRDIKNGRNETPPDLENDPLELALIRRQLHRNPPVHIRRSLDQFRYYTLPDTRKRDENQVVHRFFNARMEQWEPRIIVVDQLWLWIIDECKFGLVVRKTST